MFNKNFTDNCVCVVLPQSSKIYFECENNYTPSTISLHLFYVPQSLWGVPALAYIIFRPSCSSGCIPLASIFMVPDQGPCLSWGRLISIHPSNYNLLCQITSNCGEPQDKKKKTSQARGPQTDYSKSEIKVRREAGGGNEGRRARALQSQEICSVSLMLMNLIQSILCKTSLWW